MRVNANATRQLPPTIGSVTDVDPPTPLPRVAVTGSDVQDAAATLRAVLPPTPLEHNERLSTLTGAEVHLKREDLQPTRS